MSETITYLESQKESCEQQWKQTVAILGEFISKDALMALEVRRLESRLQALRRARHHHQLSLGVLRGSKKSLEDQLRVLNSKLDRLVVRI